VWWLSISLVTAITFICYITTQIDPYLPPPTNANQAAQAFDIANWGFRSGFGALLGLLVGRASKLKRKG